MLRWLDLRLRQIKPAYNHLPFAGLSIIFAGDGGQLRCPGDDAFYDRTKHNMKISDEGKVLFSMFTIVLKLTIVIRQKQVTILDSDSLAIKKEKTQQNQYIDMLQGLHD